MRFGYSDEQEQFRAIVARFVAEGARVGVLDRSADRLATLQSEFGDVVVTHAGDV